MSRAYAVLLAAAAGVLEVIAPIDHGAKFLIALVAVGATAGGSVYAASASKKKFGLEPLTS